MNADWDDFAARLVTTLRGVGDRMRLIVSSETAPSRYVQFAGFADKLVAETPPVRVVPDTDEAVLVEAGWRPPVSERDNWTRELVLPALTGEHVELVARCVVALRDALAVPTPRSLVYTAWRDAERVPEGVTLSAEQVADLDPGQHPMDLPELGLPVEAR